MPGPAPKDPAQRLRRNKDTIDWVDLPADPELESRDIPQFAGLGEAGRDKWSTIWVTPMATQWGDAEEGQAVRYCQLVDIWTTTKETKVLAEMRHLEAALGLTPKARKELRWRIVDGAEVVEMNGKPTGKGPRLKVVDTAS